MLRKLPATLLLAALAMVPAAAPLALPGPVPEGADPAQAGQWEAPFDGQVPAVNAIVLRNGKVLYWSGVDGSHGQSIPFLADSPEPALARVYDPATHKVSVPSPEDGGAGDMFCSGQTVLGDGRVLVVGGSRFVPVTGGSGWHVYGLDSARLFDAGSGSFATATGMLAWRWYPTAITLPDGSALVASGISDLPDWTTHVTMLERYDPAKDGWQALPQSAARLLPLYARLHVVPSGPLKGDIFYSTVGCLWCPFGERPDEAAWSLQQSLDLQSNQWTVHGPSVLGARQHGAAVMLTLRPPDYKAVMLSVAGTLQRSIAGSTTTELADLSVVPPKNQLAAPLQHGRWHLNAVLLPTGEVLAVGGGAVDSVMAYSAEDPGVLPAELFDPEGQDPVTGLPGKWSTMASMSVPRMYHSTAVLLPDGRVLVGGHVPLPNIQVVLAQVNERRLEIYDPPYLFRGARPVLSDAPGEVGFGQVFSVGTPDAGSIARVVLMRPGATTHSWDSEQRAVELEVLARGMGQLTLRAPPDGAVAPPGSYMLFLVKGSPQGPVPSVASFVRLA